MGDLLKDIWQFAPEAGLVIILTLLWLRHSRSKDKDLENTKKEHEKEINVHIIRNNELTEKLFELMRIVTEFQMLEQQIINDTELKELNKKTLEEIKKNRDILLQEIKSIKESVKRVEDITR